VKFVPEAVDYLFVDYYLTLSDIDEVTVMVKQIKSVFIKLIMNTNWMDKESKDAALKKAKAISYQVGISKALKNVSLLEEKYKGLVLYNDSFIKTFFEVIDWKTKQL